MFIRAKPDSFNLFMNILHLRLNVFILYFYKFLTLAVLILGFVHKLKEHKGTVIIDVEGGRGRKIGGPRLS